MRLTLTTQLRRRLRMLPRGAWLAAIEIALLVVLGVQVARLVWEAVTPVGSYGDWRRRAVAVLPPDARAALFAGFDPFFRAAPTESGRQTVTSLDLKLFGTRLNEASGGGSAIIATPDGAQASFAVGDEVVSGVTLKAVAADHVVLAKGGGDEVLYLDQSQPAPIARPEGDAAKADADAGAAPLSGDRLRSEIGFAPRTAAGGAVTGIAVTPAGSGGAFRAAGFQSGDVIVSVNGQPIRSVGDLQSLQQSLQPGARLSLQVERGAGTVPIAVLLPKP